MELYGNDKWWFQSVQSQSINPLYLSTIPAPTLTDPTRRKPIGRKTNFALSYSHRDSNFSALYKRLDAANIREIGHTLDAFTKRTALFSGFEVKPASGDHTEAELQMSIWIAASLRKKQELAKIAQAPFERTTLVEPALTIVGHEHSVYYAYPRDDLISGRNGVRVLGPDLDRFERLSTDSVRGIFRLVRLYGNLLKYGMDEGEEGTQLYQEYVLSIGNAYPKLFHRCQKNNVIRTSEDLHFEFGVEKGEEDGLLCAPSSFRALSISQASVSASASVRASVSIIARARASASASASAGAGISVIASASASASASTSASASASTSASTSASIIARANFIASASASISASASTSVNANASNILF
ncbi:MAG: hypothetical protein Q9187_007449 [Circinaria calcarea]